MFRPIADYVNCYKTREKELTAENASLRKQVEQLAELAPLIYREGFGDGGIVQCFPEHGIHWEGSNTKHRLDAILNGEQSEC